MEVGLVHKIDVNEEMQQAYLDYAMSVIVARALPDARDGLKPVQRRILYSMYEMGLRPDTPYKKSARIVGEVMGKYHPHGDMAIYETMARMAQDFSMRYLLVDGQGNFGSVDDDPPAAMRYTEARLAAPATHLLADIDKNTVDFSDNFDGTLREPSVLPSAIPNLLVNGATGIAVGMATSIPPHNLGEVTDAMQYLLENWEKMDDISVEDIMRFIHGPDFPTGGVVVHEEGENGLISAYSAGRGRITVQARAHQEEMERGRSRIIVTELPYMTNKSTLIERIAELAREAKLEGIVDLRDESDRQGMRIVIELSKTADPETVLRELYRHTPMQSTFSIIMLALVNGEPRLIGLKQALRVYLEHRLEIIRRRSEYELEKARQRAHILEGLRVALKNLDEVIDLIRKAPDVDTARTRLMKRFRLTEIQAQAILDMPLRRLAALERKKIEDEYKELQAQIKALEALLRSPKKMRQTVGDELAAVKLAYADRRRTHIRQVKEGEVKVALLSSAEMVPEKVTWISVTSDGLISRSLDEKPPKLAGKEAPAWTVQTTTHDTLYLVNEQGESAAVPVHAIPESESLVDGIPLSKVSPLREEHKLAAMFTLPPRPTREAGEPETETGFVITGTRQGMVKKSSVNELPGPSAGLFTLVRVNEGDRLGWLKISDGQKEVLLVTARGIAIRFSEEEIRPMGLVAAGVMGIKLQGDDQVAGMDLLPQAGDVLMVADNGSVKRVPADQFPRQGRYGQGVAAWKLPGAGRIIGMAIGPGSGRAILHLHKLAPRLMRFDEVHEQTRAARGHVIKGLKAGDQVTRLTIPWEAIQSIEEPTPRPKKTAPKRKSAAIKLDALEPKPAPAAKAKPKAKDALPKKAAPVTPSKPAGQAPTRPEGKVTGKAAAKEPAKAVPKTAQKVPAKSAAKEIPQTPAVKKAPAQTKVSDKPVTPVKKPPTAAPKPATAIAKPSKSETGSQKSAKAVPKATTKAAVKTAQKLPVKTVAKGKAQAPKGKAEASQTPKTSTAPSSVKPAKKPAARKTSPAKGKASASTTVKPASTKKKSTTTRVKAITPKKPAAKKTTSPPKKRLPAKKS